MKDKGKLFVISGPSGAGKSTVVFKAIEDRDDMCFSISVTTRKPRPGEVDGKEYFFVDLKRFDEMVANDELLEHAMYVANSYGTPRAYVQEKLDEGKNVILDIEVQGARQINEKMPEAVKIFIIPPSMAELERRLRGRGTDTDRAIEARLIRARQEYEEADFYDYIIINDDAEKAAKELARRGPYAADRSNYYDALSPCGRAGRQDRQPLSACEPRCKACKRAFRRGRGRGNAPRAQGGFQRDRRGIYRQAQH